MNSNNFMRALKIFRVYFLLLISLVLLAQPLYSQDLNKEFEEKFTYQKTDNTRLKGKLVLNYSISLSNRVVIIDLDISVEWRDANNNQINYDTQLPYIVALKNDVEFIPESSFRCVTVEENEFYNFKKSESLKFESSQDFNEKEIWINYIFQLADSYENIQKGDINKILFDGGGKRGEFNTKLTIPDFEVLAKENVIEDNKDSVSINRDIEKPDSLFLRKSEEVKIRLTNKHKKLKEALDSIKHSKSNMRPAIKFTDLNNRLDTTEIYNTDELEQIKTGFENIKTHVNSEIVNINNLETLILDYDDDYNIEIENGILLSEEQFSIEPIKNDKTRLNNEYIELRQDITLGINTINLKLNISTTEDNSNPDSLIQGIEDSTKFIDSKEIPEEKKIPIKNPSLKFLLIISGIIVLAIILIIIIKRNRKIKIEQKFGTDAKKRGNLKAGEANLYYPLSWDEINNTYVNRVSFSQNVIKDILNYSRNSLSRKMAYEVGGYIFGHFEKVGDNGVRTYDIYVDRFVPARTIESPSFYQLDFGTNAVDELETIIQNNQNMALLGWFHTHPGHTPLLSEQNKTIHKKYFYEKWQVALVLDPTDEACSAAIYANIPDGEIAKLGAGDEYFKWKNLVAWTENPNKEKVINRIHTYNNKEYFITHLNDKWCDSVVAELRIEKSCISEIQKIINKKGSGLLKNRIAGFLYGNVTEVEHKVNKTTTIEYNIVIEEFIESGPENSPSKTSGFYLMAWFGFDNCEMLELIEPALELHEKEFHENWQFVMLLSKKNNEIRMFSKKQSLEMNNNIIETNELNLRDMTEWFKSVSAKK
ncbi:hypothetical protein ACFLSI_01455 [Bacteroidota bacterium]